MAKKLALKIKKTWTFLVWKSMDLRKQNLQKHFWVIPKNSNEDNDNKKKVFDPLKIKDDEGKLINILKL